MDSAFAASLPDLWQHDPASLRATLFGLLAEGCHRRQSPLHTLTLATVTPDGSPDARTVVFRDFEPTVPRCRMHTDSRSPKVAALRQNTEAVLLWYAADWKLQLRARATVAVHHDDATTRHFWQESQLRSRRAYSAPHPPGSVQSASVSDLAPHFHEEDPTEANTAAGYQHFAVLLATIHDLEWLTLASDGNRRGRLLFGLPEPDGWRHEWLAP